MDLIIHGTYDLSTLQTLQSLGVTQFGFDLRPLSPNLIPFHTLQQLIAQLDNCRGQLIFENDKDTTISSFLSLLEEDKNKFTLSFRDQMTAHFYDSFNHPFNWMFHPQGQWSEILKASNLQALILPLRYRALYENLPDLWEQIHQRLLPVVIHVDSFSDLGLYVREKNLTLSVDLQREMESGFRKMDLIRLQNLSIWRPQNATAAGQ
jgi:hypothetical protein